MVHGLLRGEPADGRQHAKGVAAQQDDVLGVRPDAWHASVVDEGDRVRDTRVLCQGAAASEILGSALDACAPCVKTSNLRAVRLT